MAHLALYRAWRPQTFEDVVGQDHITRTLKNALSEKRFSHAYLFSGPRGTGKTSAAKIFAKAVNCETAKDEPCNTCKTCTGITEGAIMDVVEIDAASNRGVEEIRDLREKVKFAPTEAKYKVYIIDEVHMLTTEAFNALLKTLEEPPNHVIFILATTEPHKLPLTIISRCQRFDFRRIPFVKMYSRLAEITKRETYNVEEEALTLIARYSEGGMRDALSLLDQVISFGGDPISVDDVLRITGRVARDSFAEIVEQIHKGNTAAVLNILDSLINEGKEPERILEDLLNYYRDLLLYNSAPSLEEIKEKIDLDSKLTTLAKTYSDRQLYFVIESLNTYLNDIKGTNQNKLILELAIIKITNLLSQEEKEQHISNKEVLELKEKLKSLEVKIQLLMDGAQANQIALQKEVKQPKPSTVSKKLVQNELKNIDAAANEPLKKFLQMWPKLLGLVKEKKVTVHAWLIDGEPVAVTEDKIILAFNNVMHRDTTNKPANKKLIEEVISEALNRPYTVINVMQKEWQDHLNIKTANETTVEKNNEEINSTIDLKTKALELFGNELVVIKD